MFIYYILECVVLKYKFRRVKIMGRDRERPKKTSKINTWKPKKNQILVEPDGKLFICHFDKIFGIDKLSVYNRFMICKGSYENQLEIITKYTNFFMNVYDNDGELATAYLRLKASLDKLNEYTADNMNSFIDFIYEVMFTPTIVEKIVQMVEENYLDDIETDTEEKKKYIKNTKVHLESLEFTNQHIKILLRISFAMKIMSPVLFHYLYKNVIKIEKDSDIIYQFYQRLFKIFGYGTTYELYSANDELIEDGISQETVNELIQAGELMEVPIQTDISGVVERHYYNREGQYYTLCKINMYNKLYVYVKTKVLESNSNNSGIFEQREIFGVDVFTVINQFTKKVLISENMVKYKFNENWDTKQHKYKENVIGFNKTIIKYQLNYFLKEQYLKNLTEVTNTKNSDGLSGIDKMAMNLSKIDEGACTLAEMNIKLTINKIKRLIDVPISDEEVDFYLKHHKPSKIQIRLIRSYYTRYFGSYRDLNLLSMRDYIVLALILKKKLLIELGFEDSNTNQPAGLPYLLTGNLKDKVNTRIIRNNCFISKIEEEYLYDNLVNPEYGKYRYLEEIDPDYIKSLLSMLINTKFTYVVYEEPQMLGEEIVYSEDKIGDECTFFLNSLK